MDILIDRLYRTRLQVGYEPQERRHETPASEYYTHHAYGGSDVAELSLLSILFYTTEKRADGEYFNKPGQFAVSPLAPELDDYSPQFKRITTLHEPVEKVYRKASFGTAEDAKYILSETLDITLIEASSLLHLGEIAKGAYQRASQGDEQPKVQQMINFVV